MIPSPVFALALCLSAPLQAPAAPRFEAVASFVGEEAAAVLHVDLTRLDARSAVRRVLGKADDTDVASPLILLADRLDALKKAGARDLFLVFDPADVPGLPVAVVPIDGDGDREAICGVLGGQGPGALPRWPGCEPIRGAVVAGSVQALERVRTMRPAPRPGLSAALAAGGDAPVRLAIVPSLTQRRAIEETMPDLPSALGGGPVSSLSRGMAWASVAIAIDPTPTVRIDVQALDPTAAAAIEKVAVQALATVVRSVRATPTLAPMADDLARLRPATRGDRVTLSVDLDKAASLVAVPLKQVRAASRRTACTNNLKQIALAMHNYLSAQGTFPPAYNAVKDGKPLLSWRVHILPFLEQKALYDEFHLDEPWDSDHNKPLIARMPAVYACPDAGKGVGAGMTSYLTLRGPATIFPGASGVKIQDISDGTSNTILVVDADDASAVIWTKPSDRESSPDSSTKGLFGHHPGGANTAFADGSARFLRETITPKVFRELSTRNGGEVINGNDF